MYVWILGGAVRGTGDSLIPMLLTCVGVCVLRVLWVWIAVPFRRELTFVVLSYPITWATTSCLFIFYYLRGNWLRRRIFQRGLKPEEAGNGKKQGAHKQGKGA